MLEHILEQVQVFLLIQLLNDLNMLEKVQHNIIHMFVMLQVQLQNLATLAQIQQERNM